MRFATTVLALLLTVSQVRSQDISLEVKGAGVKQIKVDRIVIVQEDKTLVTSFPFTISAPSGTGICFWQYPPGVVAIDRNDKLEIKSAPTGELTISVKCLTADWDKKILITKFGQVTFLVGDVPPGPKPPEPKPPEPKPPTPATGLRVLMVGETGPSGKWTRGQLNVWNSTVLKAYLDSKCVKGSDGRPEWRKWDIQVVITKDTETMKALWAATKPQLNNLPALVIVTDQNGEIYPLPDTEQAVIDLIKKKLGE